MKFHRVEVQSVERLGEYVVTRYLWDEEIRPGQFVMARAAGYPQTLDPFLARPLSVYDHVDGVASLLYEVRGRGTQNLALASEAIELSRPLGNGFDLGLASGGKALLLGGGIGIAPFRLLSRWMDERGISHDVVLGFADEALAGASAGFSGAKIATMDGSVGTRGTVLDAVASLEGYSAVYACGPNPMLAAIKAATPENIPCQLSVEERMGCGNGSCNGCVVPVEGRGYVRSCIEGPVFESEVLAW